MKSPNEDITGMRKKCISKEFVFERSRMPIVVQSLTTASVVHGTAASVSPWGWSEVQNHIIPNPGHLLVM